MEIGTKLGRRVAELRRRAGITQAQFAERLDVATETVSRFERGIVLPSLGTLASIASALEVPMDSLLRFGGSPTDTSDAIERLVIELRGRTSAEIELVTDLARRIFRGVNAPSEKGGRSRRRAPNP